MWSVNKLYRLVQCCIVLPSVNVALPNEHIRHFFLGGSPLGWGRRRVGKRRPRPLSLQGQLSCHFPLDNNKPDYSKGSDWWCDDGWRNFAAGVWRWWFWVYSHFHCFTFWLPVMNNKQHTKFNNVYSCAVCSISMPILIKPHQHKSIHNNNLYSTAKLKSACLRNILYSAPNQSLFINSLSKWSIWVMHLNYIVDINQCIHYVQYPVLYIHLHITLQNKKYL